MIRLDGVTFRYGRESTPVFEGFTWQVEAGEAWSVVGASGCGKSTLLYLIAGLRQPQAGTVSVGGIAASAPANRGRVGLVLQDYGLLPWATALDNARLGLRVRHLPGWRGGEASVGYWLGRLGVGHLVDRYPAQLSGGERQRVAIARALVLQPVVLLLDEPFSALDAPTRESLERLTVDLSEEALPAAKGADLARGAPDQGREGPREARRAVPSISSVVLVTHSIREAVAVGRRILVLGKPPNREAVIVENPLPSAERRSHPDFDSICQLVRVALGSGVTA